jgi:hypothetical protein
MLVNFLVLMLQCKKKLENLAAQNAEIPYHPLLYRVIYKELIQSKDLAWQDVLTNLPKTDAQWLGQA